MFLSISRLQTYPSTRRIRPRHQVRQKKTKKTKRSKNQAISQHKRGRRKVSMYKNVKEEGIRFIVI